MLEQNNAPVSENVSKKIPFLLRWPVISVIYLFFGFIFIVPLGLMIARLVCNKKHPEWKTTPKQRTRAALIAVGIFVGLILIAVFLPSSPSEEPESSAATSGTTAATTAATTTTASTTAASTTTASSTTALATTAPKTTAASTSVTVQEYTINNKTMRQLKRKLSRNDIDGANDILSPMDSEEKLLYLPTVEEVFLEIVEEQNLYLNDPATKDLATEYFALIPAEDSIMELYLELDIRKSDLEISRSLYPTYTGSLQSLNHVEYKEVYVASRVESSKHFEIGGVSLNEKYTDAYYITEVDYLLGEAFSGDDWEAIIVSSTPLEKGVLRAYMMQSGTYGIVTYDGFEKDLAKYYIVSENEIEEFRSYESYKDTVESLEREINSIGVAMSDLLISGDKQKAITYLSQDTAADPKPGSGETLETAPFNYEGEWGDDVSQRCYMNIACEDNVYIGEIQWASSADFNTIWTFNAIYDSSKGGLVYQNGICKNYIYDESGNEETETVYTDGYGLIYEKNGHLYWVDQKEYVGDDCEFTLIQRQPSFLTESSGQQRTLLAVEMIQLTARDIMQSCGDLFGVDYTAEGGYSGTMLYHFKDTPDYYLCIEPNDWDVPELKGYESIAAIIVVDDGIIAEGLRADMTAKELRNVPGWQFTEDKYYDEMENCVIYSCDLTKDCETIVEQKVISVSFQWYGDHDADAPADDVFVGCYEKE